MRWPTGSFAVRGGRHRLSHVTVLDEPTCVVTLIAATPAYAIGHIDPAIEQSYRAVGRSLGSQARAESYPQCLFLTRRSAKRGCWARSDVEAYFAKPASGSCTRRRTTWLVGRDDEAALS